jgi:hypothetical protein
MAAARARSLVVRSTVSRALRTETFVLASKAISGMSLPTASAQRTSSRSWESLRRGVDCDDERKADFLK